MSKENKMGTFLSDKILIYQGGMMGKINEYGAMGKIIKVAPCEK
jgi:hypothetical protein